MNMNYRKILSKSLWVNRLKGLPDSRSNWKKYGWKAAPVDTVYKEVLNIGLNYYNGNKKLRK